MTLKQVCMKLVSLKSLLIISFIALMALTGFLGYILTAVQGQKSMNDMAELTLYDLTYSILILVQDKVSVGHKMNIMENSYFRAKNQTMNNFVVGWKYWRPITVNSMRSVVPDTFVVSQLSWKTNYELSFFFSPSVKTVTTVNFDKVKCQDPNLPIDGDCIGTGVEKYPLVNETLWPDWNMPQPGIDQTYQVAQQGYWVSGPVSSGFVPTTQSPFKVGYSAIAPYNYNGVPMLSIHCASTIAGPDFQVAGQLSKMLLLGFLDNHLLSLTNNHPLLLQSGRAFVTEFATGMLVSASHGGVFQKMGDQITRFSVWDSPDKIIQRAGQGVPTASKGGALQSVNFKFGAVGHDFLCMGEPLTDTYGLSWMVTLVLSLSDLFRDINNAALRMLLWTAITILGLSVLVSILISYLVTSPLQRLSEEMGVVAEMRLDGVKDSKSRFYEISVIQGFFHAMVEKLKEYRAFLPEAILGQDEGDFRTSITPSPEPSGRGASAMGAIPNPAAATTSSVVTSPQQAVGAGASKDPYFGLSPNQQQAAVIDDPMKPSVLLNSAIAAPLVRRAVSVLHVDIRSFHSYMDRQAVLVSIHSDVVQNFSKAVQENYGMCNPILGDKMLAFWNVNSVRNNHRALCAAAAVKFQLAIASLGDQTNPDTPSVAIACTTGAGVFGPMGTKTVRSFTVIAPCISRSFFLQKLTKLIPLKAVCDDGIREHAKANAPARLVAVLPINGKSVEIFEFLEDQATPPKADAWVHEPAKGSSQSELELGLRCLFDENKDAAVSHFKAQVKTTPQDPVATWYLEHIDEMRRLFCQRWGFMFPAQLLCTPPQSRVAPVAGKPGVGAGNGGDASGGAASSSTLDA